MAQHKNRGASDAGERPRRMSEEERRERLTQLVLCRSKLSPDEAALLREVFPEIVDAHHDQVWNHLRRRGLDSHEVEDLVQEVFLALHKHILEKGFVDNLPGMLHDITQGQFLNHVERALHFEGVSRRIFSQVSLEHQEVIDTVVRKGLSETEAAAVLGIPLGTLKSRLMAAKRAVLAAAQPLLPPSERGPL